MIILRVLMGRGWTKDTMTCMTSMRFATRTAPEADVSASDTDRSGTTAVTLRDISKSDIIVGLCCSTREKRGIRYIIRDVTELLIYMEGKVRGHTVRCQSGNGAGLF